MQTTIKIDFDYWTSFIFLPIRALALLLDNHDPNDPSVEIFYLEDNKFASLLENAAEDGTLEEPTKGGSNSIIKGKYTLESFIRFILNSNISNENEFKDYCKRLVLIRNIGSCLELTYKDQKGNITCREVELVRLVENKIKIKELVELQEPIEKDFVISRILQIKNYC